jgi:hypothetical protein
MMNAEVDVVTSAFFSLVLCTLRYYLEYKTALWIKVK